MPEVTDVNRLVKDSAYAAVGFGVLGFQKAQVRRREFVEQLGRQGGQLGTISSHLSQIGDQVGTQFSQLGSQVAQLRPAGATAGDPVAAVRTSLVDVARRIDSQVQPVRRQLDDRLSEVEELLPAPTRTVVRSLRTAAQTQEAALRSAIGLGA
jgi:ABC-type transporter Mla subunit MlaD